MYTIDELNDRLQVEFRGRLRARLSAVREDMVFIEEQVGRGVNDLLLRVGYKDRAQREQRHDQLVRVAQGYALVLTIRLGDRFPCTKCSAPQRTPMFTFAGVKCTCGNETVEGFFPLNDALVDYLRYIDPEREDARERVRREDAAKRYADKIEDKDRDSMLGDELFDVAMSQIPKIGYTGRVLPGTEI